MMQLSRAQIRSAGYAVLVPCFRHGCFGVLKTACKGLFSTKILVCCCSSRILCISCLYQIPTNRGISAQIALYNPCCDQHYCMKCDAANNACTVADHKSPVVMWSGCTAGLTRGPWIISCAKTGESCGRACGGSCSAADRSNPATAAVTCNCPRGHTCTLPHSEQEFQSLFCHCTYGTFKKEVV